MRLQADLHTEDTMSLSIQRTPIETRQVLFTVQYMNRTHDYFLHRNAQSRQLLLQPKIMNPRV